MQDHGSAACVPTSQVHAQAPVARIISVAQLLIVRLAAGDVVAIPFSTWQGGGVCEGAGWSGAGGWGDRGARGGAPRAMTRLLLRMDHEHA